MKVSRFATAFAAVAVLSVDGGAAAAAGSNVLPPINPLPGTTLLCIPVAQQNNTAHGNNNQTGGNATATCQQNATATPPPPPPPPSGLTGYERKLGPSVKINATEPTGTSVARCSAGKKATGGGFSISQGTLDGVSMSTIPQEDGSGWAVIAERAKTAASPVIFEAWVVCYDAAP